MAAAQELPGDFIIRESRQNREDCFNNLVYPLLPPSVLYNKKDITERCKFAIFHHNEGLGKKYYSQPTISYDLEFKHSNSTIKHIANITDVYIILYNICIYDVCVCSIPVVLSPIGLSIFLHQPPPPI